MTKILVIKGEAPIRDKIVTVLKYESYAVRTRLDRQEIIKSRSSGGHEAGEITADS
jgi:hypothetical protein